MRVSEVAISFSKSQAGMPEHKVSPMAGQWIMWVDGVGGYLLLPGDDWTLGGPTGSNDAEICIQGDLMRREACIRRQGADYVLQPLGTVLLGGRRMNRPAVLKDGDTFRLGGTGQGDFGSLRGVQVEFAKPHPLSASARLTLESRHRTRPRSDGIVLVADTCVVGPNRASHVIAPAASGEVVLLFRQGEWFCRGAGETEINGQPVSGRAVVPPGARVETGGIAFSLEAVLS
jgi:hypothetical protein